MEDLAAFALFVPVYRFGVTVVPAFYGKEFDPYNDVLLVPGLVHLLTHRLASWQVWAVWMAVSVAAAVAFFLAAKAFRALLALGTERVQGLAILAVCVLAAATTWLDRPAGAARGRVWREGETAAVPFRRPACSSCPHPTARPRPQARRAGRAARRAQGPIAAPPAR